MKGASPNVIVAAFVAVLAIGAALIVGLAFADSPTNDTTPLVTTIGMGAAQLLVLLFNTLRTSQTHARTAQLTEQVSTVAEQVQHVEEAINGGAGNGHQGAQERRGPPGG